MRFCENKGEVRTLSSSKCPNCLKILFLLCSTTFLFSCSRKSADTFSNQLIIWTDRGEIASYVEAFNASQSKTKAVIVYKKNLADSLPPAKDEHSPDIILGSWLKNSKTTKYFKPIDYFFLDFSVKATDFYEELLKYGSILNRQYLLPVSFDLPAVIFSVENENLVPKNLAITTSQLKESAEKFNKKNKNEVFTQMGFAPSWNSDFLYFMAKLNGLSVKQKRNNYIWNDEAIETSLSELKNWSRSSNDSVGAEQDFSFKYLYTPDYQYVNSGHCLFAYTTVSHLFDTPWEQLSHISFRWLSTDEDEDNSKKLPIEDDVVMLGVYKKSENEGGSNAFIRWFFNEETQKMLLERTREMNLQSQTFGIFGGFSSLIGVNIHTFPIFYQNLLGNIPMADSLLSPVALPIRWQSLKERVLIPYLTESLQSDEQPEKSLDDRTLDWTKQFN